MKVRIALELFFLKIFLDFEKIDSKNLNFKTSQVTHRPPTDPQNVAVTFFVPKSISE